MRYLIFIMMTCCLHSSVWAGFNRGNGGNIIQCTSSAESNQLLDIYELTNKWQFHVWDQISSQQDPKMIVQAALNRLGQKNPALTQLIQQRYVYFLSHLVWTDVVTQVDDVKAIQIPTDCHLTQIAVQYWDWDRFKGPVHTFYVKRSFYDQLSPLNQAGLILHEVIWSLIIDNDLNIGKVGWVDNENSAETRYEVAGILASDDDFNKNYANLFNWYTEKDPWGLK